MLRAQSSSEEVLCDHKRVDSEEGRAVQDELEDRESKQVVANEKLQLVSACVSVTTGYRQEINLEGVD